MFAGACVSNVAAFIFAIKATRQVQPVLDDFKENLAHLHDQVMDEATERKAITKLYAKTAAKLTKLYSPSIVLAALSFVMAYGCKDILGRRNAKLAAAYASLASAYNASMAEVERRYGIAEKQDIKAPRDAVIDEENGEVLDEGKPEEIGDYGRLFAHGYSYAWQPDGSVNLTFLKAQQAYANQILTSRGYLFLHEVYEMLGVRDSDAAHMVGWIWSDKPGHEGDNYVSFGIDNLQNPRVNAFLNGETDEIWLDFNCQGLIIGKIGLSQL